MEVGLPGLFQELKDHIAGMENSSYYFQKHNKLWSNPLRCLSVVFFFFMLKKQFYCYSLHLRVSLPELMRLPITICLWYTSYTFVVKSAE